MTRPVRNEKSSERSEHNLGDYVSIIGYSSLSYQPSCQSIRVQLRLIQYGMTWRSQRRIQKSSEHLTNLADGNDRTISGVDQMNSDDSIGRPDQTKRITNYTSS